jgi:peptidoglycan/LPS O-acetylase OafA/YrhL
MSSINKFNTTINGTRGVAVLCVLFFHLEFFLFKGGFVGVDIFFVISGYLISKKIITKIQSSNFLFKEYFIRRLKRILPSYIFVITISFILIIIIFIDTHYEYSIKEIFYSLFFLQNFYYWDLSGYFGLENLYKPLLNTWSLAVELQFYFFFPFLFMLLKRKIIILIIISLFFSVFYIDRNFSYFFLPTRFFEFGVGILLFLFYQKKNEIQKNLYSDFLFIFGISFLIISILYLDSNKPFPGFYALIPCLGTAMIIISSKNSKYNYLLDNKFFNFFGNISYSLYLIHWPLIIFYKYFFIKINLNIFDQTIVFLFSVIFSYILTFFYEIRFYKKKTLTPFISFKKILLFYLIFILIIFILFLFTKHNEKKEKNSRLERNKEYYIMHNYSQTENLKKKILILGNSHGKDLYRSLISNDYFIKNYQIDYEEFGDQCFQAYINQNDYVAKLEIIISGILNLINKNCKDHIPKLINSILLKNADTIIISNRYKKSSLDYLSPFIKKIKTVNNQIILINNGPRFIDPMTLIKLHKNLTIDKINQKFYLYQDKAILNFNENLKDIAKSENIILFDKYSIICSNISASCNVLSKNNKLLFLDMDHFSEYGYKFFGKKLFDQRFYNLF